MPSFYAQWYYYVIVLKGKTANSLRLEAVPTLRCWRVKGGGRAARLHAAVPAAIVELVPSGRPTEVHECKQQDCKVVKRELLDAKWEHFDLERRNWRIPVSKSGKARNVALSSAALEVLNEVLRWEGCPYVVPNPKTRLPFVSIHEQWMTTCRRAGLKDVRMHDLRHTFASNLVNAGQSLFVVSRALGHSTTRMSERYAHLSNETLLAAADAAANAMGTSWSTAKKATLAG